MKTVFKVLAYIVAAEVAVQSAMMVFAVAGLGIWVDGGGVFDKAAFEDENLSFTGIAGFMVHGINGMMIIPVLALALLVISFFTKLPGAIRNSALVLALVVLQVMLGLFGHENAYIGMLHGLNALVLFTTALLTARSAGVATRQQTAEASTQARAAV